MQIHSLSKVLILPVVLAGILIIYRAETIGPKDFSVWVLIPGLVLAAILVLSPQIDFWYRKRFPGKLDPAIQRWLELYHSYYIQLNQEHKERFRNRINIYLFGREFKAVGSEIRDVPEDVMGIIASIPVMLTMNREDFLLNGYDRIYIYKHAFPSPEYQFYHTFELNKEDGMVILSLEHLLAGMITKENYNIGLHAFALAYLDCFNPGEMPLNDEIDDTLLELCSGFTIERIKSTLGYNQVDKRAVLVYCYFTHPQILFENQPVWYQKLANIFNEFYSGD
ncbi:MAG TPA: zinc-dependent peptidase [Saprospiraceae bacterium]|nr:zinc-dependent peptidase [Saprospiraceae bacterium]